MTAADVHITQAHIDRGVIGNCTRCPIALGLKETFPALEIDVAFSAVHITTPECDHYRYTTLHSSAKKFIVDFDDGKPVKPFSFPFEVPEDLVQYLSPSLGPQDNILEF